jgi:peptidoglycan/LPS O-acetylase OafA/YrhL
MLRPLFLARASYRRRRLRDAARLLPIVGGFLLAAADPLDARWPDQPDGGRHHLLLRVWLCLIVVAAAFAPGLRGGDRGEEEED